MTKPTKSILIMRRAAFRAFRRRRCWWVAVLVLAFGVMSGWEHHLHAADTAKIASLCANLQKVDAQIETIASNTEMYEFLKGKGEDFSKANRLWADVRAAGAASNQHRRGREGWWERLCAAAWNMDPDPSSRSWPQECKEYMEKDEQLLDKYNKVRKSYESYMDRVISGDTELREISISNYAQFKSSWAQWDKTHKNDLASKPQLDAERDRLRKEIKSLEASCP